MAREVKIGLRGAFEKNVVGLNGLRCLFLIADKDEEALGTWSMNTEDKVHLVTKNQRVHLPTVRHKVGGSPSYNQSPILRIC